MENLKEQTVGSIVARDYRTASVFKKFGLDFCCGGDRTLTKACSESDVDIQKVEAALANFKDTVNGENQNYNEWSPDFLVDYIINNHHKFSRNKLSEIADYVRKVTRVHGQNHPELKEINEEFTMLYADISNHLDKEERILFPYIKTLVDAQKNNTSPEKPEFGKAANPIAMMEEEHDESGDSMKKIRALSNDFRAPEDACTTYRLLYENLEGFEKDLHKHIHLENNILFPKAIELENRLN